MDKFCAFGDYGTAGCKFLVISADTFTEAKKSALRYTASNLCLVDAHGKTTVLREDGVDNG